MLAALALTCIAACTPGSDGERAAASSARVTVDEQPSEAARLVRAMQSFSTPGAHSAWRTTLLPSDAVGFDVVEDRLAPRWSERARRLSRRTIELSLPADATQAMTLRDGRSGLAVDVRLEGATSSTAVMLDGYLVYPGGHAYGEAVLWRPTVGGAEEYILFRERPPVAEVSYRIDLGERVAGLRQAGNVLELLDRRSVPRLRMSSPKLVDAEGIAHDVAMEVDGCAVSRSMPRTDAPVLAPGARRCSLTLRWDADVSYPALLDPVWKTTDLMAHDRAGARAVLLTPTTALVAGGTEGITPRPSEEYDVVLDTFIVGVSPMNAVRARFCLQRLADGRVLAAGGDDPAYQTAEVYDAGVWTTVGTMTQSRNPSACALVGNGTNQRVVVAGGMPGTTLDVYDPSVAPPNEWSSLASTGMHLFPQAVRLPDGRALLVTTVLGMVGAAEIYDGLALQAVATYPGAASFGAELVVLSDARVLAVGGGDGAGGNAMQPSLHAYQPSADMWIPYGTLDVERILPIASALGQDWVLVAGGVDGANTMAAYTSAVLLDPNGMLHPTMPMAVARSSAATVRFADGRVLVAGGFFYINDSGGGVQSAVTDSTELFGLLPGETVCALDGECASGVCTAEGRCCDSACSGACMSCVATEKGTGVDGVCGPVALGMDPGNDCLDSGASCQEDGSCDGNGACRMYVDPAACTPGPCSDGAECASGYCVDGVCCDRACTDPCEGCALPGHVGTCSITDALPQGRACQEAVEGACREQLCNGRRSTCVFAATEEGCKPTCASADDCAPGRICSSEHLCVTPDVAEGGCGCRIVGRATAARQPPRDRRGTVHWSLLVLAWAVAMRQLTRAAPRL